MSTFKLSQRITGVLFIITITLYFLANVIIQRNELLYGFGDIKPANTINDITRQAVQIEDVINRNSYQREKLVNLYSFVQMLLNKEENGNFDLVRATDGSLHFGGFYPFIMNDIEECVIRLRNLKDYANSKGCEVLFVNPLAMHTTGYTTYSAGLPYKNENPAMDTILYYLQTYSIDYIDLREAIKQYSIAPEKYRYKTDHNWTIEASFVGFAALAQKLKNDYSKDIDPKNQYTNPANYSYTIYPKRLTGTLGTRSGIAFSGSEDFTLLQPKFPTSFYTETDNGNGIKEQKGNFTEALINTYYLSTHNMYLSYLNGLAVYKKITNLNNEDGLKILFINDSASLPLAAFMASAVKDIEMIYPLSQNLFNYKPDIEQHIKERIKNYDFIIIELISDNFNKEAIYFFSE